MNAKGNEQINEMSLKANGMSGVVDPGHTLNAFKDSFDPTQI